jgi:hypothetical protein
MTARSCEPMPRTRRPKGVKSRRALRIARKQTPSQISLGTPRNWPTAQLRLFALSSAEILMERSVESQKPTDVTTPLIASVAMKEGMRSLVETIPPRDPAAPPARTASGTAANPKRGRPTARTQLDIEATLCTDRSIPPIMITKVTPDAIKKSVMVSAIMVSRLLLEKKERS